MYRLLQDEALSAALSDAGFGLQFADVAVDEYGQGVWKRYSAFGTALSGNRCQMRRRGP